MIHPLTALALLNLLVCSIYCNSVIASSSVSVPKPVGNFLFGMTGYYVAPFSSSDNLDYPPTVAENVVNFNHISAKHDWAWGVFGSYSIPCTTSDFMLEYFNVDSTENHTFLSDHIIGVGNDFNFPLSDPAELFPINLGKAEIRRDYEINQLDLTAGQTWRAGCHLLLRPAVGLRWLQVKQRLFTDFTQSTEITPNQETIVQTQRVDFTEYSKFNGVGPWIGMDASFCVGCGFGFVGHFDTALVIGRATASTHESVEQLIEIPDTVSDTALGAWSFERNREDRVLPVIDLRLGANYTLAFSRCTNAIIEAGWMMSQYFSALDRQQTATVLANAGENGDVSPVIVAASVQKNYTSDLSVNGPYIRISFRF